MVRGIVAVITGYVIFALSAVLLFQFSGQNIHSNVSTGFMLLTIVYGIVFAGISGFVTASLVQKKNLAYVKALAILMGSIALVSLIAQWGKVASWSQLAAIFLMAPSAFYSGLLRANQIKRKRK